MQAEVIGILGLGEGGTAVARGLAGDSGWRTGKPGRSLVAVDIALDKDERGRAMHARAQQIGIAISDTYGPQVGTADVLFSLVTGEEAQNAAEAAARFIRPGTWYFDLATITRAISEADCAAVQAAGGRYVDVAVMGTFLGFGYKAPMVLAGPDAEEAAAWLTSLGFDVRVLGPVAGTASGLKLVRSILMKGIEALGVECLVAARQQGIVDDLLANIGDADRMGLAGFLSMLVQTHVVHARRRMEEMEMVEQMLGELGMAPMMTAATIASHRRTIAAGAAPADGTVPDLEGALAILTDKVVRPRP